MPGDGWAERYCRFLLRRRWLAIPVAAVVLVWGASSAQQLRLLTSITDYYPDRHPHIRLYQDFPEMLRMTNAVVVLVSVKDGDLYNTETLGKIHRLTVGLLETKGVNPHEVLSLTHSRLTDIKIRDGMINILPVVRTPGQTQSPQELARIKNAVYTNLGIRGVYVSEDNKTALIRAGFWDAEVNPYRVFSRLRRFAAQERDANTEVAFAGNIVLAGWLMEAGPRVLLVLVLSALAALLLAGVCGILPGVVHTVGGLLIVSGLAAAGGLGLLGMAGHSFEPLAWLMLFPLAGRGLCLVLGWTSRVTSEWQTSSERQNTPPQAVVRTVRALWRPCTSAVLIDGLSLGVVAWWSDVPAVRTFGLLGTGWLLGLLMSVWLVLPAWSAGFRYGALGRGELPLIARFTPRLRSLAQTRALTRTGCIALAFFGLLAALQLEAGRSMLGSRLFPTGHPYSRAFGLLNQHFIGVNQLIVVAHTPGEAGFRDLGALQVLEAFQLHMAADRQFGGAVAVPGFVKSITRMFHENIPKWAMLPDDISSTGQIIFRIVAGATTPSEVGSFLSTDFRTTAVTLFYRDYSPGLVKRALARLRSFEGPNTGMPVEFRSGGGLLGVVAAIHTGVACSYWSLLSALLGLAFCGGLIGLGSMRAAGLLSLAVVLSQAVMLIVLWVANIDLNMHTLPVVLVALGTVILPASLALRDTDTADHAPAWDWLGSALTALAIVSAGAALVWLLSPLRLQTEMGLYMLGLSLANTLIPLQLQSLNRPAEPLSGQTA